MAEKLLRMEHIRKSFFSVVALDDVNLELSRGEVLCVVGENGAGKSTLMKILSGSYPANSYSGNIYIDGEKKQFMLTHDAEIAGIEMIYQEISLMDDLTVAENILLGRLPQRRIKGFVDWKRAQKQGQEALDLINLKIDPNELVRNLNTSQKQLLSIAKAVYRKPKILVLDEPTSALTDRETERLFDIIRSLKAQGIACIYISHKLDEVFTIADRITVLRDGKTINSYDAEGVSRDRVIEDMVGRKLSNMYPKIEVPIGQEALRVEHITVPSTIPGKRVVDDVSFSVRRGEILGIGGLVGAGRSELVSAIFGTLKREAGEIYVYGEKADIRSPLDAIRYKIGFVTEDRRMNGFVGTMSIRENISLASFDRISRRGFVNHQVEKQDTQAQFDALRIKAQGVETNVLTLSGGNQQKVVVGKWLMKGSEILFLDEPTRGIDVGAKVEIYNIMFEMAKNGAAIVMISSELPELKGVCDRFLVLHEGKVGGVFSREEFTDENYLKAATGMLPAAAQDQTKGIA